MAEIVPPNIESPIPATLHVSRSSQDNEAIESLWK
jgi:hypothetical protein